MPKNMESQTNNITSDLITGYFKQFPEESARLLETFEIVEILPYLKSQSDGTARRLFTNLNPEIAAEVLLFMDDAYYMQLFSQIDPYFSARLLSRLKLKEVEHKLSLLPPALSREVKELMRYPQDSAGYIMDTKVFTFHPTNTVKDVLKRVRAYEDRQIVNVYVIDDHGHLKGFVPLQQIAISKPSELLENLMQEPPGTIHAMADREEVVDLLEEKKLFSLPVVDFDNTLLGIIRNEALMSATRMDASEDLQAMFGAGREERALSKVFYAVKKRLPWLHINLATAFLAASVVGFFEDTIAKITVLAVFLPVVAGQSGNTGSQALAVTMRGLALKEIRAAQWLRVARKEIAVGFLNGVAVAITTSVIVFVWASSFGLAVVIAISMIVSMSIAGLSGAVIPIMLKSLGQDPAQSSSIILTTVTDIVGFFSFLGLATVLAAALGIA